MGKSIDRPGVDELTCGGGSDIAFHEQVFRHGEDFLPAQAGDIQAMGPGDDRSQDGRAVGQVAAQQEPLKTDRHKGPVFGPR